MKLEQLGVGVANHFLERLVELFIAVFVEDLLRFGGIAPPGQTTGLSIGQDGSLGVGSLRGAAR